MGRQKLLIPSFVEQAIFGFWHFKQGGKLRYSFTLVKNLNSVWGENMLILYHRPQFYRSTCVGFWMRLGCLSCVILIQFYAYFSVICHFYCNLLKFATWIKALFLFHLKIQYVSFLPSLLACIFSSILSPSRPRSNFLLPK